jgi:autotransporter-associated beta strand protein
VTTAGTGLALATGSSTNLSAGVITLQNGGTIDLTSTNTSRGIVQFGSTNATFTTGHSTGTFNLDGGMLTAGQIVQGSTDAAISSTFNFNGGTLKVKADTALGATFMAGLSQANVKAGGAKIDTNGVDITIAQNLQHDATLGTLADGGLTKQGGTGTLILAGANSYTGATTISAGTLKLASTGTIDDSSAVNVAAGATFDISAKAGGYTVNGLGGGGTITAGVGQTLTLSASGALTPGNSIGTLLVSNGNLMLESGATYAMEIGGSTAAPENDRVDLLGAGSTVLLGGNYTLDLSRIGTLDPTGMSFVLFDADAPIASPGAWSIDYGTTGWTGGQVLLNPGDNTQLILTGVSVPEPTSLTLLGALGAGLLSRRRRRC